ncbi:hypothetical protein [Amycolatopsis sp. NPDC003861]
MPKFPVKSAIAAAVGVALTGFLVAAGPVSAVQPPTTTTTSTSTTATTKPTSTTGTTATTSTGPTKTVTSTPKTPARPVPKGGVETGGGGTAPDGPGA